MLLWTRRERLRAPFQSQKGLKFCACGRHLNCILWTERLCPQWYFHWFSKETSFWVQMSWSQGALKSQRSISTPAEKSTQAAQLPPPLEYEVSTAYVSYRIEGGFSPLSLKSDTLPLHGPKAQPLLEARRLVYCIITVYQKKMSDFGNSSQPPLTPPVALDWRPPLGAKIYDPPLQKLACSRMLVAYFGSRKGTDWWGSRKRQPTLTSLHCKLFIWWRIF